MDEADSLLLEFGVNEARSQPRNAATTTLTPSIRLS